MTTPRISLTATLLAAGATLLGCLLPLPTGPWLLASGAALLPVALMVHAARRHGATRGARYVFLALTLLLAGTLTALILLHGAGTTGSTSLLLQLLGLWLLPLLLTGIGYAATFAPAKCPPRTPPEDAPPEKRRP